MARGMPLLARPTGAVILLLNHGAGQHSRSTATDRHSSGEETRTGGRGDEHSRRNCGKDQPSWRPVGRSILFLPAATDTVTAALRSAVFPVRPPASDADKKESLRTEPSRLSTSGVPAYS